ncbi:cytosolic sulfotransferase 12-like [Lotus japonicus]|uniref:cytosolic sulfotransferase 12-like n=1 Tax=Lotus japonicus TaxID=34305 RepID=UPI00258CA6A1|nr:cytosolic sulfotransferase 12-like [Lotus japonicus]
MSEAQSTDPLPKYLQENEITQECLELIPTLPREKGWVASHLHQYQGFWHNTRQLQGVLSCQKHFQAHNTDIFIVTIPKSGTTWLKALTFSLLNRHKYPNIQQNHPLLTHNPHFLVPFLELVLYQPKDRDFPPDLNSLPSPRLFSTHLPHVSLPKSIVDSSCKIVYLCRDPKDTFISMWYFTNRLRLENKGTNSLEEAFEKFCRGVSLCGPFWDHVLGYWKKSLEEPEKVMFLRFEDMKMKPACVLKELARFLGCPFSEKEEGAGVVDEIIKQCSFDELSNLEVNKKEKLSSGEEHKAFFRRGEVGDWKNHLTDEMVEQMNTITEKKLAEDGLTF